MKSFMTKFASVPTVLVLLLPVGVVAIALGHVLPPTVAKQAETRGQPPSAIQDPRLTQSQILPQHVSPLQPRPTRPNAREPQRLLPDDLLATTPEPPAPAVEIPKYGIGPRAVPSHHHRHPSALRPPRVTRATHPGSPARGAPPPAQRPTPTPASPAGERPTATTRNATPTTRPRWTCFSPTPLPPLIASPSSANPDFSPEVNKKLPVMA